MCLCIYRGTLLIRKRAPQDSTVGLCLGPYGGPRGRRRFLMSEVPLYWGKHPLATPPRKKQHNLARLPHAESFITTLPPFRCLPRSSTDRGNPESQRAGASQQPNCRGPYLAGRDDSGHPTRDSTWANAFAFCAAGRAISVHIPKKRKLRNQKSIVSKRDPLGSGAEGAQHKQTLRRSVDGVRSNALRPFGLQ